MPGRRRILGLLVTGDVPDAPLHGLGTEAEARLDPFRLRLILLNLLSNALKYTSRGGVTLASQIDPPAGDVVFEVADTGPGLEARVLADLETHFSRQVVSAPTHAGLGLFICQQLTRSMGGRIEAASRPGEGSLIASSSQPRPPHEPVQKTVGTCP